MTDKMVGFVLPSNESVAYLSLIHSLRCHLILQKKHFLQLKYYVFVYMAQPLEENVSAYCLMCTVTNNDAELISKCWKYISMPQTSYSVMGLMVTPNKFRSMELSTGLFDKSSVNETVPLTITLLTIAPSLKFP